MPRQIAIRLGTEGKAQVVADLDAIGTTGDAAFNRLAKSAVKAGRDADAAMEFANKQASKLAALLPGLNPTNLDMAAGVRDSVGKSAETSAAVFEAAYAKMEARAAALRSAIDPAYGAQQRFNRDIGEARSLVSAGAISLDDYVAKLRQEQAALDAVTVNHGKAGNSAGAQRAAMQGLSYQLQDTFTQLSMGTNALQVFAIQGGQVAGQFSNLEGKAGNFARFMIGPWELAITAAMLVLGPLVGKLLDGNNAIDEAVDKLKKDAKETENTRVAKERFAKTAEGVAAAIREGTAATLKAIEADKSSAEQANINAKNNLAEEISIRRKTLAKLADAKAAAGEMLGDDPGIGAQIGRDLRVSQLEKDLKEQAALIKAAEARVQETRIALSTEAAARMVDPMARIKKRYDDMAAAARNEAREAAKAGKDVTTALTQRLGAIERDRAATIKAEQDKQKALNQTAKVDKETVTANQVAKLLRAELPGVRIGSTSRTPEHNRAVGGAPNSYHVKGNAIDFTPAGGMGSITKEDVRRIFTARGINVLELLGPGDKGHSDHFHVAWTKGKQSLDDFNDAAKRSKEAQRDLDRANKDLDSDLDEVVKQFDPAKAAADDYAASLAKIAALQTAGRLTTGQASGYKMEAYHQEQKRQADAQLAQFKVLFGAEDPLADTMNLIQIQRDAEVQSRADDYDKRKAGIRDLASYYRDAMTGGTKSIMDMFRQRGLDAISEMLAKWTLSKIGSSGGGGLLGAFTKLIGGASALAGGSSAFAGADLNVGTVSAGGGPYLPKLASGTEYWSGGEALLGEHGPEKAWLPKGTRVTPAGATRRMGDDQPRGGVTHNYFSGNLMTPEFWQQIQAGDANAAMQGAAGGAAMGQADAQAAGMKRLGRFR